MNGCLFCNAFECEEIRIHIIWNTMFLVFMSHTTAALIIGSTWKPLILLKYREVHIDKNNHKHQTVMLQLHSWPLMAMSMWFSTVSKRKQENSHVLPHSKPMNLFSQLLLYIHALLQSLSNLEAYGWTKITFAVVAVIVESLWIYGWYDRHGVLQIGGSHPDHGVC